MAASFRASNSSENLHKGSLSGGCSQHLPPQLDGQNAVRLSGSPVIRSVQAPQPLHGLHSEPPCPSLRIACAKKSCQACVRVPSARNAPRQFGGCSLRYFLKSFFLSSIHC